jgi:hypothetical protein
LAACLAGGVWTVAEHATASVHTKHWSVTWSAVTMAEDVFCMRTDRPAVAARVSSATVHTPPARHAANTAKLNAYHQTLNAYCD